MLSEPSALTSSKSSAYAVLLRAFGPSVRNCDGLCIRNGCTFATHEALSRGAAHATFVESDRDACRAINRNLDKLGLDDATVLCQDALTALRADARAGTRYDLVLVDPPYRRFSSLQNALIQHLPEILAPDGRLVVETAAAEEPELLPLAKRTSRRYGAARLTLFEQRGP